MSRRISRPRPRATDRVAAAPRRRARAAPRCSPAARGLGTSRAKTTGPARADLTLNLGVWQVPETGERRFFFSVEAIDGGVFPYGATPGVATLRSSGSHGAGIPGTPYATRNWLAPDSPVPLMHTRLGFRYIGLRSLTRNPIGRRNTLFPSSACSLTPAFRGGPSRWGSTTAGWRGHGDCALPGGRARPCSPHKRTRRHGIVPHSPFLTPPSPVRIEMSCPMSYASPTSLRNPGTSSSSIQ